MVCTIRQLGELRCYGHRIGGVGEVTRNLDALNCFLLPSECKGYRIALLDVVLNDQRDFPFTSARLQRNVARLVGGLQSLRIGLRILLRQSRNLLAVVLELRRLLFDYMLLEPATTGW